MLRNFRKLNPKDKQRYLRYDDVFLGARKPHAEPSNFRESREKPINNNYRNYPVNAEDDYMSEDDFDQNEETSYNRDSAEARDAEYFSGRNSIIDERMMKYQKRQLPPLQRYSPNSYRDQYSDFNQTYWEDGYPPTKSPNVTSLKMLWQKFIVTFASIISLVCVAWIAYNWNSNNHHSNRVTQGGVPLIEPDQQEFRVLPDNPGGEEIAYKDKTVYEKVNNKTLQPQEKLLPPQDDISYIPASENSVEEYSIIDDKTYYIKISAGKAKPILQNELKLLKKKYPEFIDENNTSIKRVSNSAGEKKYAILIGPFDSQDNAIDMAKNIGGQCYVISVKD